ncbi:hypothetical protein BLNAU_17925 [Blattamonas nauphoetae]|uniref:Uncharacterized protein n=1 Tax=Blattamonas nauphoetae TaxID=2049346 RepID=A0ABQ9X5W2_9EUKA|nr:hypothetical protein BLNAU_17925 [Blattamonas nauphoetae]
MEVTTPSVSPNVFEKAIQKILEEVNALHDQFNDEHMPLDVFYSGLLAVHNKLKTVSDQISDTISKMTNEVKNTEQTHATIIDLLTRTPNNEELIQLKQKSDELLRLSQNELKNYSNCLYLTNRILKTITDQIQELNNVMQGKEIVREYAKEDPTPTKSPQVVSPGPEDSTAPTPLETKLSEAEEIQRLKRHLNDLEAEVTQFDEYKVQHEKKISELNTTIQEGKERERRLQEMIGSLLLLQKNTLSSTQVVTFSAETGQQKE